MANLEQIEKYLKRKKLPYRVIDLGSEVFTVKGVKEAGVDEDEIVKTLIVRSNDGFVALAVRGKDRVDFKKVRKLFGSKSELAKAEEVEKVAKVPVGAVCPILLNILIYIDKRVLTLEHVHMGSGDLTRGLEMKLEDFLEAIGDYQVEEFALA